jgi:hypothetical protein
VDGHWDAANAAHLGDIALGRRHEVGHAVGQDHDGGHAARLGLAAIVQSDRRHNTLPQVGRVFGDHGLNLGVGLFLVGGCHGNEFLQDVDVRGKGDNAETVALVERLEDGAGGVLDEVENREAVAFRLLAFDGGHGSILGHAAGHVDDEDNVTGHMLRRSGHLGIVRRRCCVLAGKIGWLVRRRHFDDDAVLSRKAVNSDRDWKLAWLGPQRQVLLGSIVFLLGSLLFGRGKEWYTNLKCVSGLVRMEK